MVSDKEILVLMIALLKEGILHFGWDYPVVQKQQPTQQGLPFGDLDNPNDGAVFIERLDDDNYLFKELKQTHNPSDHTFSETESQIAETTFQMSAIVPQNPSDTTRPTAADVAKALRMWMTSRYVMRKLTAQKFNILPPRALKNAWFVDDTGRNQAHAHFDYVLTYISADTIIKPAAISVSGDEIGV